MANRIKDAVDRAELRVAAKLASGEITQAKADQCRKDMDMPLDEFCKFQSLKSFAFACGKLSLEEATYVFEMLGDTPSVFNARSVAEKTVLSQLFAELLELEIRRRGGRVPARR